MARTSWAALSFTHHFIGGSRVLDVPVGRYFVSATHVLNHVREQLLLSSADQKTFAPRVLAVSRDAGGLYANTMELYLKNP